MSWSDLDCRSQYRCQPRLLAADTAHYATQYGNVKYNTKDTHTIVSTHTDEPNGADEDVQEQTREEVVEAIRKMNNHCQGKITFLQKFIWWFRDSRQNVQNSIKNVGI